MITIEEPQKRNLSQEESLTLRLKFIDLLYVLLVVYLTLHQFLIPFVGNLFRGDVFYHDVSWSFIVHFYGIYELKKNKSMSLGFYSFLWGLTVVQIIHGALTLGKWGLFSLVLTQTTTIVFLYFVYPFVTKERKTISLVVALVCSLACGALFSLVKVNSPEKSRASQRSIQMHEEDFQVKLPAPLPILSEVSVWELGNRAVRFNDHFIVKNDKKSVIDIRLYELKIAEHRVKWKYVRLAQLRLNDVWNLPLSNDAIYLVKSPERRDLKSLILIPQHYQFPLGEGILSVGFNSIVWQGVKNAE